MTQVAAQADTPLYRVIANRPGTPCLPVYAGFDYDAAQAVYDAEAHAYFCAQVGTFGPAPHYRPAGLVTTIGNAHK